MTFHSDLFGTDGIRGRANQWPITPAVMVQVGRAVAYYFQAQRTAKAPQTSTFFPYTKHIHDQQKLTVVIGKDTRLSGYMIETAITAGLTAQGANVIMLGPLPTPAIAMLVRSLRADIGIMISASHNPYYDNGVKFFDSKGIKFDETTEGAIANIVQNEEIPLPNDCGGALRLDDAAGRYVEFAKATFPKGCRLDGMKIALDCANGAAYKVAPQVFWELGASVVTASNSPNGRNINQNCGAVYPDTLIEITKRNNVDIGIALDGDADRVFVVTPQGATVNGDQIIALIAKNFHEAGVLKGGVVSTCMSNIGLKAFLQSRGIPYFESKVGDKNVVEVMNKYSSNLGGEESGHIILGDYATTGDGITAALQILRILVEQKTTIDAVFPVFQETPRVVKNFQLPSSRPAANTDALIERIKTEGSAMLGGQGAIVARRSGTEPKLRVMVQHDDPALIEATLLRAEQLVQALGKEANAVD
jgi:phosphoglucosamine mutase